MRFILFSILSLMMLSPLAAAQTNSSVTADINSVAGQPILIELFTSQSCSSCPKAEDVFSELSERDDLVVIEWHVDYWDNLVHGRDGSWKDPYSSNANTLRQRDYNFALRETGSVYTPQAVIAGASETTGSREKTIERLIKRAPKPSVEINMTYDAAGMSVSVKPTETSETMEAEVMFVELMSSATNAIEGGENRGLTASSRNVAISNDTLGAWTGTVETYRARKVNGDHSCAVIVQEKGTGLILGASYCPTGEAVASEDGDPLSPDFIRAHP